MASLTDTELAAELDAAGFPVTADEAFKLAAYLRLLERWNRVHNLTAIRDTAEIVERHLAESLALEPFIVGDRVADIGSGGGLPGIPLAIRRPDIRFVLIESRRKRVSFLRHVAASIGLPNVAVAHGRAEELGLGTFTSVLARAVAEPRKLLAVAEPLVARDGRFIVLTSQTKGDEILELAQGFRSIAAARHGPAARSRIVVLERRLS